MKSDRDLEVGFLVIKNVSAPLKTYTFFIFKKSF
ncbi:MAG: hypothetical protein K0S39_5942 [Paenibacillus sp.]|jgi:hypothetical protein|nr:hypothetical protein [Paenibacillus sp.]